MFRYAIATGRAERDPSPDLRGALPPAKETHYPALTDPKAIGDLLRAIQGYKGGFISRRSPVSRGWDMTGQGILTGTLPEASWPFRSGPATCGSAKRRAGARAPGPGRHHQGRRRRENPPETGVEGIGVDAQPANASSEEKLSDGVKGALL